MDPLIVGDGGGSHKTVSVQFGQAAGTPYIPSFVKHCT